MAQSILTPKLLSPNTIHAWLKPSIFASSPSTAIGKPWEIWRAESYTDGHLVDFYTKSGDVFSYSSMQVLIPGYRVGFVVLTAGQRDFHREDPDGYNRGDGNPGAGGDGEGAGFGEPGEQGLVVTSWYSNRTDFLATLTGLEGTTGVDVRLYPSQLVQQSSPDSHQVGYRAVIIDESLVYDGGLFSADCETWAMTSRIKYGIVGLDGFVFEVHGGTVVAVSPRALRVELRKGA